MASAPLCNFDDCDKPPVRRGYCENHYRVLLRSGALPRKIVSHEKARWIKERMSFDGEDCLIWPFKASAGGYGRLEVFGQKVGAHRYMCSLVFGPPPTPKHVVAHSCGCGHLGCVNPKHLRWATVKENYEDSVAHGTANFVRVRARLSRDQVDQIRHLEGTVSRMELARRYGVDRSTIYRIVSNRAWT